MGSCFAKPCDRLTHNFSNILCPVCHTKLTYCETCHTKYVKCCRVNYRTDLSSHCSDKTHYKYQIGCSRCSIPIFCFNRIGYFVYCRECDHPKHFKCKHYNFVLADEIDKQYPERKVEKKESEKGERRKKFVFNPIKLPDPPKCIKCPKYAEKGYRLCSGCLWDLTRHCLKCGLDSMDPRFNDYYDNPPKFCDKCHHFHVGHCGKPSLGIVRREYFGGYQEMLGTVYCDCVSFEPDQIRKCNHVFTNGDEYRT